MKIKIATALTAAGLLAACQPAADKPRTEDATAVAEGASAVAAPVAPLGATGPAQNIGAQAVETAKPSRETASSPRQPVAQPKRQSSPRSPSQTQPQTKPAPMKSHDMSTMPDMHGMDHSPN